MESGRMFVKVLPSSAVGFGLDDQQEDIAAKGWRGSP